MRTSPDYYKTREGKIIAIFQNTEPPEDSVLIFGYDYQNQKWVLSGKSEVENLIFNQHKTIPVLK